MKRFIGLVLAMLLISSLGFGEVVPTLLGEDKDINVSVTVEPYAELTIANEFVFVGSLDNPEASLNESLGFSIEANCGITMTLSEVGFTEIDQLILGATVNGGATKDYPYNGGVINDLINLTAEFNPEVPWYGLEHGIHNGSITVTISNYDEPA